LILQLSKIAFSINGEVKLKIFFEFLFKKLKKVLFEIKECFKTSPYPQIISLFDNDFKNCISVITRFG